MIGTLYDVYSKLETETKIQNNLLTKYIVENEGTIKYTVGRFLDFKMIEDKQVTS